MALMRPNIPKPQAGNQYATPEHEITQFFESLLDRPPTPEELAQFTDADKNTWGELIKPALTPEEQNFGTWAAPPAEQAPQAAPPVQSSGGGGYSGPSLNDPFTQTFSAPPLVDLGGPAGIPYVPQTPNYTAPIFTPPVYKPPPEFSYQDFVGPNADSFKNTPGYQARLNEGERALTNSRAAQGILGTGSTLKDILAYGQDYAANEFNNEWNRELTGYQTNRTNAVDTYNTNYGTQYVDPYKFAYQGAMDAFAPRMAEFNANVGAGNLAYSTQAAAGQHQSDLNHSSAWDQYLFDYNNKRNQKLDTFQILNSLG